MSKLEDMCIKAVEIKSPLTNMAKLYQCEYHKALCLKPEAFKQCHHYIMHNYRERIGEVYKGD